MHINKWGSLNNILFDVWLYYLTIMLICEVLCIYRLFAEKEVGDFFWEKGKYEYTYWVVL
jgi:hypothetical protein